MANIEYSKATITDKDGKVIKEPKKDSKEEGTYAWWKDWKTKQEETLANEIAGSIKFMQKHDSARMEQLTVASRLYGNTSAFSLMGSAFTRASSVAPST